MKGVGVLRFLEFYHKMALHGKNVKFTKIPKTLKAPLFMFSPSRAGGSFLSHEGGRKSVRWKNELQGVTLLWKLQRLLRLQPST